MAAVNEANPLGLPLEPTGLPHQLRLVRPAEQDAGRRTALCTAAFNFLAQSGQTPRFNTLERPYQIAAVLIRDEPNTFTRLEAFKRAPLNNRQTALYNSEHREENAAIMFQETGLGHIINFIAYQASLGFPEVLGPAHGAGAAAAGPDDDDQGGRYDQAYLARKMQADDMKNAKAFLQY